MALPTLERTPDGWELQFASSQRQGLLRAGETRTLGGAVNSAVFNLGIAVAPLASGLVIGTGLGLAGTAWIGARGLRGGPHGQRAAGPSSHPASRSGVTAPTAVVEPEHAPAAS
ncbi:hypothetical protein ACFV2H_31390 [Streptomyces sp. NPDC059629]|uniref:hypothetical protein n=1 Tax=Streptomyces sp. NPDC059629 TaxID=3346889 RepID=UPI0036799B75